MDTLTIVASVRQKFDLLRPIMTERMRRQWAVSEALALPRGGMTLVAQATGLSRTTIWAGVRELQNPSASLRRVNDPRRSRREGGGRHLVEVNDPRLPEDLERLVDPATRGDPISPLRWTCKSTRKLADELQRRGHNVSHQTVALLLQASGCSLQSNRKTREGGSHGLLGHGRRVNPGPGRLSGALAGARQNPPWADADSNGSLVPPPP